MAPLIAHVSTNRQVEEHSFGVALVQPVLRPVILDFMVIKNHVSWHAAQELSHVPRPKCAVVAFLKFLVAIREANWNRAVELIRVYLVAHHEREIHRTLLVL